MQQARPKDTGSARVTRARLLQAGHPVERPATAGACQLRSLKQLAPLDDSTATMQWLQEEGSRSVSSRRAMSKPKSSVSGSLLTIEFDPGDHGLLMEGTRVVCARKPASTLGVGEGWFVTKVENEAVQTGAEVECLLQKVRRSFRKYTIEFQKPNVSGEYPLMYFNDMPKYIEALRQEFKFQASISGPENQATTISQLQRVVSFATTHCHTWCDQSGANLSLKAITCQHLLDWVIKPSTKERNCSMVELLAAEAQPASWYVSHSWGERFSDLSRSIECHGNTRKVSRNCGYWLAAFALPQHSGDQDPVSDPTNSALWRAMRRTGYRMLLVTGEQLREAGAGSPFRRLWCIFEMSMCLGQATACLDVAASSEGVVHLLTMTRTEEEVKMDHETPASGSKRWFERCRNFPLVVIKDALALDVGEAQSSKQHDRRLLLNCFAGRDQEEDPPEKNDRYLEQLNVKLRAFLALAFWRRVNLPRSTDEDTQFWAMKEMASKMLEKDTMRSRLSLSLAGCDDQQEAAKALARLASSFPPMLRELHLDLAKTGATDSCMEGLIRQFPRHLDQISLNLTECPGITDRSMVMLWHRVPPNLKGLDLGLRGSGLSERTRHWCSTLERFNFWDPDVDRAEHDGSTQLMRACQRGSIFEIQELLQKDAKVDVQDANGCTALMLAVKHHQLDSVNLLLGSNPQRQVRLKDLQGRTALMHAVLVKDYNMVLALLRRGVDQAQDKDQEGCTALALAILGQSDEKLLGVLLDKLGGQVVMQDKHGRTPLTYAISSCNLNLASVLLQKTPERQVLLSDSEGLFPLMRCVLTTNKSMVQLLLSICPDRQVKLRDRDGRIALAYAAQCGLPEICELLLLESGNQQVLEQDSNGRTALMHAILNKQEETACKLLEVAPHLQVNLRDNTPTSPLLAAVKTGCSSAFLQKLKDCGARDGSHV